MKGEIKFYNHKQGLLFSQTYTSREQREGILKTVRNLYGRQFQKMYYHICPTQGGDLLTLKAKKALTAA